MKNIPRLLLDKGTCTLPSSVFSLLCEFPWGAGRPDTNRPPEKVELPLPGHEAGGRGRTRGSSRPNLTAWRTRRTEPRTCRCPCHHCEPAGLGPGARVDTSLSPSAPSWTEGSANACPGSCRVLAPGGGGSSPGTGFPHRQGRGSLTLHRLVSLWETSVNSGSVATCQNEDLLHRGSSCHREQRRTDGSRPRPRSVSHHPCQPQQAHRDTEGDGKSSRVDVASSSS